MPPATLALHRYYVSDRRRHFMFDHDRYEAWVLLAPAHGSFSFSLEAPPGVLRRSASPGRPTPLAGRCAFGELVLCPPGATLRRRLLSPTVFHFGEFGWDGPLPAGRVGIGDVARLGSTFDYLAAEHAASLGRLTPAVLHLVSDLLYLVATTQTSPQDGTDPLMRRAAARIEQGCVSADLSLHDLAGSLGLSPSQLTRRFRAAYGTTPVAYCRTARLTRARRLLLESEETLERIAAQCGYRSAFYFSRVFTQQIGQPPSAYRRRHQV